MNVLTLQPDFRRLLALLLVSIAVSVSLAQERTEFPGRESGVLSLVDVTSKLHVALPSTANNSEAVALPILIPSGKYSLDFARRTLVPAIGGSVAVGDFNGDGRADLYVVIPGASNHLLQQLPDGTFSDATEKGKVSGTGADLSATFGDFDKSGRSSLFVAGLGGVTLYRNNGDGTFTDVTAKSGLRFKPGDLATSVLLFDADGDGFLDALVTVYTDFSVPPAKASFTFPNDFAGANSRLYRNQHDGTFAEVTESAGLDDNPGRTHMALAADFNQNGKMDLLLLRDNKPPALFRNHGQGKFEDQTWDAGREIWKYAYVQGQIADFNHDGKVDAVLWSTIGNEVLINQGNGKFDQEDSLPLVYAANRVFGFHGIAADLSGHGYDDLLTLDNKSNWHFIRNRAGHFQEASVRWSLEPGSPDLANARPTAPSFVSLTAARLRKGNEVMLVGLTKDGRLRIFEPQQTRNSSERLKVQKK
jgi:hypothetical protein